MNSIPHLKKLTLLFIIILLWDKSAILYAKSDSLPYKFYFLIKKRNWSPEKHQLIAIKDHDTKYVLHAQFIKIVAGVFGDKVRIINNQVWVNELFVGNLKSHTLDSKVLTPIKNQTIPAGWMFVCATHIDSFDSRYVEFGLVHINKAIGLVKPLW